MDTRLTLKLDEKAIERAKLYASRHGVSLSRLVESYFSSLVEREEKTPPALTGVVAELAGILAGKEIDFSKEGRARYLARAIRPRLKPGARNGCPSGTER